MVVESLDQSFFGKAQREARANWLTAIGRLYGEAHRFGEALDDGEAQPRPRLFAVRALDPPERLKDVALAAGRETWPLVQN